MNDGTGTSKVPTLDCHVHQHFGACFLAEFHDLQFARRSGKEGNSHGRYAEMEEAIVINDKYVYFLQNQRQELHILLKRTGFS